MLIFDAWSGTELLVAFALFILAGLVKGFTGVGLPMVAIPLLSQILDPATAITIVVRPAAASNVVQSLRGGYLPALLKRFWSLCLALVVVIGATTPFIIGLDTSTLLLLVGGIVSAASLLQLLQPSIRVPAEKEALWNPVAGNPGWTDLRRGQSAWRLDGDLLPGARAGTRSPGRRDRHGLRGRSIPDLRGLFLVRSSHSGDR